MTACKAICHDCPPDQSGRPRTWRELCVDCLNNTIDRHRLDTGHHHIDITIIEELTVETVRSRQQARRAYWQAKRMGMFHGL